VGGQGGGLPVESRPAVGMQATISSKAAFTSCVEVLGSLCPVAVPVPRMRRQLLSGKIPAAAPSNPKRNQGKNMIFWFSLCGEKKQRQKHKASLLQLALCTQTLSRAGWAPRRTRA
jgi:hypothetical protein